MAQISQPHRPRRREEPQGPSAIVVWWASISPGTKKAVGIVFLFALGLLGLLSIFELAGSIGVWMDSMMGILFGRIKLIFPLLLLLLAYVFLRPDKYSVKGINTIGLIIVAVSFAAFWHIGIDPETAWRTALEGGGGGIVGFSFAYPLHVTLGFWGGLIILVAIFVSALLVIFNTSLSSLQGHVSALKDIGGRFS
ncbi:MAG: DNA translocase FtsK 4TM domain-containing protein, partial [Patescibacteria group bacterium]